MKSFKSVIVTVGAPLLIFLGACSNGNQATNPDNSSTVSTPSESASSNNSAKTDSSGQESVSKKGGQVVESGNYHLELVPEPDKSGTHIDFYLQKGDNHEAIPNAKVTAQIQMPDGTQKNLPLSYDEQGKHYTALLTETASGQYQLKVISDINGEKVDGRFSFKK